VVLGARKGAEATGTNLLREGFNCGWVPSPEASQAATASNATNTKPKGVGRVAVRLQVMPRVPNRRAWSSRPKVVVVGVLPGRNEGSIALVIDECLFLVMII